MIVEGLQCAYDANRDFVEVPNQRHPNDSRYSAWECTKCHALFEDNPGYGFFTSFWGENGSGADFKYNPNVEEHK